MNHFSVCIYVIMSVCIYVIMSVCLYVCLQICRSHFFLKPLYSTTYIFYIRFKKIFYIDFYCFHYLNRSYGRFVLVFLVLTDKTNIIFVIFCYFRNFGLFDYYVNNCMLYLLYISKVFSYRIHCYNTENTYIIPQIKQLIDRTQD